MKKFFSLLLSLIMVVSVLSVNAFAYSTEFSNGPANSFYNRTNARDYLNSYTRTPNPAYYTYGGADCTNFVSQMARAGGMDMTSQKSSPTSADWYYYGPNIPQRTPSWTGAHQFRQYWGVVNGVGHKKANAMYKYSASELKNNASAYASLVSRCEIGDVIQLVNSSGTTYHSMGVQRVYYEGTTRKVTISQHTDNEFYHLSNKIANLGDSTWVCLLKMKSTSAGSVSSINVGTIQQLLGQELLSNTMGINQISATSSVAQIAKSMDNNQLASLVDTLQDTPTNAISEDNLKWQALADISKVLDARHLEELKTYGEDAIPKTVVTKDLLISFINDRLTTYRTISQIPSDTDLIDQDAAIMSTAEAKQEANLMIEELSTFLEEAENYATDSNSYAYWCTYWTDILGESMPYSYCEAT